MKKFIALLCMLTCVFSLTACGGDDTMNTYQAEKVAMVEQNAVNYIIPMMEDSIVNEAILDIYQVDGYTNEEWETVISNSFGISVDGEAYVNGIESFLSGTEKLGKIVSVGEASATVDGDTIIVNVDVVGEYKNGQVELIFSNDYFGVLESCTLNVFESFGELMARAAMNTLLGMGTVFAVLILIMFIIDAFVFIPKIQEAFSKKDKKEEAPTAPVAAAPAVEEAVEEADDHELVAVIAAAIAAYEGKTSTDGFVVRSIKKSRRR